MRALSVAIPTAIPSDGHDDVTCTLCLGGRMIAALANELVEAGLTSSEAGALLRDVADWLESAAQETH